MKRVLLKNKKTGKIGELSGVNRIIVYEPEMPLCGNSILGEYDTLEKLNEEWEDYKPIEPLIKDEKIRKAVRAWAEANSIKEIIIFDCGNNAPYTPVGTVEFAENAGHLKMQFRTEERFDTNRIYTIEELCGEEEECES